MKRMISKKLTATLRRFSAGMLALLMSMAYAVPSWATCACCESMNVQPTAIDEAVEGDVPSCHAVVPTSDGSTEEIASATEEIASATEEIASATEEISNGCDMDCMTDAQVPTAIAPGVLQSHGSHSESKTPVPLSDLVYVDVHVNANVLSSSAHASSICPIHHSTASVPLRI
jgi:hypothetical protein